MLSIPARRPHPCASAWRLIAACVLIAPVLTACEITEVEPEIELVVENRTGQTVNVEVRRNNGSHERINDECVLWDFLASFSVRAGDTHSKTVRNSASDISVLTSRSGPGSGITSCTVRYRPQSPVLIVVR